MTSRVWLCSIALGLALAGSAPPATAQQRSAEALLQQAANHELVGGELSKAIALYREIIDKHSGNRRAAAQALANLGRAYEKLGASEARSAYQRLLRDYADQAESVRFARVRLEALDAANGAGVRLASAPVYSMVYDELPPLRPRDNPQYDFSPNGDQIVMRVPPDGGDSTLGTSLVVANSSGAVLRTIVPARREVGRVSPRWSPDGKYIAYVERTFIGADVPAFTALKVIPAEGGEPRTLSSTARSSGPATGGVFWTPDSRAVTIASREGLVTIDLNGEVVRTVQFRARYLTQFTGYSPDGRWLALHQVPEGTEQELMEIWIMPAEGGRAIQLTPSGEWNAWPAWAADGRSLYFISNRGGSSNVWRVNIDAESGLPQGEPSQVTSYTDARILYPRPAGSGKLGFALVRQTGSIRVAAADAPDRNRAVARGTDAILSPDGQTVYYVGQGVMPPGIFAVQAQGGTPRRLTSTWPGGTEFTSFSLSRDGRSLAYFSQLGRDNVLFTVPSAGGAPREVTRFESREHLVPSWSPDGTQLAYSHDNGLYVIPASGGNARAIANLYRWDGWTVRWSPDGAHVAALAWTRPGDSTTNAVFVVPAAGGEPRQITPAEETGYKEMLEWHPDSRRVSYMYYGDDDRGDGSRTAYVDGRPTTLLVNQPYPVWDYVGVWNPIGRDYYFIASAGGGSWNLYAHDEKAGSTRLAWHNGGTSPGAGVPSFSRDGHTMAWPTATTTRQLWIIDGVR